MKRFGRLPRNLLPRFSFYLSCLRWGTVVPYKLADIGEGITEVEVVAVHVRLGDRINEFDKICEVQSDKAMVDITSRYNGVVKHVHVIEGGTAIVGRPIIDIEVQDDVEGVTGSCDEAKGADSGVAATQNATDASAEKITPTNTTSAEESGADGGGGGSGTALKGVSSTKKPLATPATRAFARDCGVNLSDVAGSGAGGRVLKEDVSGFVGRSSGNEAGDVVVPLLKGIRRVMVSSMTEAGSIPSFTACEEVELTALLNFRERVKEMIVSRGKADPALKVTLLPLFLKAASLALLQYPEINAHITHKCESLVVRKAHNIGFAVDSPKGLIIPVVRNVEQKSIMDVVQEVNELVALSKKNQIPPNNMRDGTFTISNVGTIGATYATPMILPPQVAISAFGRIQLLPRFDAEGNVFKANIICLSSTADHRVIDGATMVRFNNTFKNFLESPEPMLSDK